MTDGTQALDRLEGIGRSVQEHFDANKRVLTFGEYLTLAEAEPTRQLRGAAQYLRDMFDHYGVETVRHPRGPVTRYRLFDAPWDHGEGRLIGQEEVQGAIYRILRNFVRQRRVDRFILLHGPNGSAKSTIAEMLSRAMEHYSTVPEGALYRFNWIFPSQRVVRSGIGFGGVRRPVDVRDSYAHLEDAAVDARLHCELRDHPFLLIPKEQRLQLFEQWLGGAISKDRDGFAVSQYLVKGNLCHKCKLIYESLLSTYEGDYLQVLRHVQVERFYVSRRYRVGSARVEPQFAVDARTRQITADRSLGSLPTALQSVSLFELDGELVHANRGIVDFADLLKRPIEAYKYLLTAVEDSRVALDQFNLFLDLVFIGSANEGHLNAFMESPDWMSFKGRMELVRVPYLLDYTRERQIYEEQIREGQVGKHIAPHATLVASLWAVLTRMRRPELSHYESDLRDLVAKLTPKDKAGLYGEGLLPAGLREELAKTLRAGIPQVYAETDADVVYEGSTGASPREVKTLIMNAAQNHGYGCLSPEAVLQEIGRLVQETSVYDFLREEVEGHGFHDHKGFLEVARQVYLEQADDELRWAMGLVEEASYAELFGRYVMQVTHHVRKEQLRNPMTGRFENPDVKFMVEVEKGLGVAGDLEEFRQNVMTKIGAWSVDHPKAMPDYAVIFPEYFSRLRDGYYEQQHKRVRKLLHDALLALSDEGASLPPEDRALADQTIARLKERYRYCEVCAREVVTMLIRRRYLE